MFKLKETRNPEARCSNCPYWDGFKFPKDIGEGICKRNTPPHNQVIRGDGWCGQHPEFWIIEEVEE